MAVMVLVARWFLAAIFALAGITKLADPDGFMKSLIDFGLPETLGKAFGIVLPVVEIICAGLLLPSASARWGAIGVLVLLAVFIVAISLSLARGRAPDCHCFGQLHSEPIGAKTLAR